MMMVDVVDNDYDDTDNVSGLRSYGKVVYVFGTLPIIGFVVFACKILALFPLVRCLDLHKDEFFCLCFYFFFAQVSFQSWLYNQDWSLFIYNKNVITVRSFYFDYSENMIRMMVMIMMVPVRDEDEVSN